MTGERIWWLSLPQHANLPEGVIVKGTIQEESDRLWDKYGGDAQMMKPGLHELTPPTLGSIITANLLVHDDFTGAHKIDYSNGKLRLHREPTHKYMSVDDGIDLVMIPEQERRHDVAFFSVEGPIVLYYMLRWVVSPGLNVSLHQRELVGAGAGFGGNEQKPVTNNPFDRLPQLVGNR